MALTLGEPTWATSSWATNAWTDDSWDVDAGAGESLAAGDLTTAFDAWLDQLSGVLDMNTRIRDALATHYGVSQPADLSTMLARFLRDRQ